MHSNKLEIVLTWSSHWSDSHKSNSHFDNQVQNSFKYTNILRTSSIEDIQYLVFVLSLSDSNKCE